MVSLTFNPIEKRRRRKSPAGGTGGVPSLAQKMAFAQNPPCLHKNPSPTPQKKPVLFPVFVLHPVYPLFLSFSNTKGYSHFVKIRAMR
jgi:hypothetical protein